jgi:lysozyme family protein
MLLDKEMKEIKTIKETLDRRVAELQMKAERVTMLENERKRFQDREAHFTEATSKIKDELEEV